MKIYTKKGDQGQTRLVDGTLVEKFNQRVEAYGTVDELNSYLGLIISCLNQLALNPEQKSFHEKYVTSQKSMASYLTDIQIQLFNLGSQLATEDSTIVAQLPPIHSEALQSLESEIDWMTQKLPPLKNFILPTGHIISSHLHIARTICRRAERRAVEINIKNLSAEAQLGIKYLNRLSDFLFTAARFANLSSHTEEILWKKN